MDSKFYSSAPARAPDLPPGRTPLRSVPDLGKIPAANDDVERSLFGRLRPLFPSPQWAGRLLGAAAFLLPSNFFLKGTERNWEDHNRLFQNLGRFPFQERALIDLMASSFPEARQKLERAIQYQDIRPLQEMIEEAKKRPDVSQLQQEAEQRWRQLMANGEAVSFSSLLWNLARQYRGGAEFLFAGTPQVMMSAGAGSAPRQVTTPDLKRKKQWKEIRTLVIQVLAMPDAAFKMMKAGAVPPGTPAEELVRLCDPFIREATRKFVRLWNVRGGSFEYNEIYQMMRAFFPLFFKARNYDPEKIHPLTFARKFFFWSHFSRFMEPFHPEFHQYQKAQRTVWDRTRGKGLSRKERYAALNEELAKRNLRDVRNKKREREEEVPLIDRLSGDKTEDPRHREQLLLAVAYAIYDFLKNPEISPHIKEAFLLRRNPRQISLKKIGDILDMSSAGISLWEKSALTYWKVNLERYYAELKTEDLFSGEYEQDAKILRGFRNMLEPSQLARVMAQAGFPRERWRFWEERLPGALPPLLLAEDLRSAEGWHSSEIWTFKSRFRFMEDLRTMQLSDVETLRRGMEHFFLTFMQSWDDPNRIYAFKATSPEEWRAIRGTRSGYYYIEVRLNKAGSKYPYAIVGYNKREKTRVILDQFFLPTGLFELK